MIVEIISACIALFAVIVSVWFGRKNHCLNRKNAELQRRLLELEENREAAQRKAASKAQLRARIVQDGRDLLMITNDGESEARNIVLKLDGQPFKDHCASYRNDWEAKIIDAHSEATSPIAPCDECAPPWKIEIFWEDDSGEPEYHRHTLT